MLAIFYVILGLVLLVVFGEIFVRSIIALSNTLNLSSFAVGAAVVSIGTMAPDFFFAVISASKGHFDASIGSLIGGVITKILLCIGIASLISGIQFNSTDSNLKFNVKYHFLFFILFIVFIFLTNGKIGFIFAFALLMNGIFFLFFNLRSKSEVDPEEVDQNKLQTQVYVLSSIVSLFGLFLSSNFLLKHLIEASEFFNIPEKVISSMIVGLVNNISEITIAILASLKKRSRIIIGNVIGGNMMTFTFILGTISLISNIMFGKKFQVIMPFLVMDLPFLLLVCIVFFSSFLITNRFGKIIGLIFIFLYLIYFLLQFNVI